jgi:N utilization substance protein B
MSDPAKGPEAKPGKPQGTNGRPTGRPSLERNRRRRARELALQALFSLDHKPSATAPHAGLGPTLYRMRERALVGEIECRFADAQMDELPALVEALLLLDPKHEGGLEYAAALAQKGPKPLPPSADERAEYEAVRGTLDELTFMETLVKGVADHKDAIDKTISESSTNWKVPRMAIVDRNILRVGVFELERLPDIPARVTLNEAIEIAKRYGTGESGAFINGILDKIATQLGKVGKKAAAPELDDEDEAEAS